MIIQNSGEYNIESKNDIKNKSEYSSECEVCKLKRWVRHAIIVASILSSVRRRIGPCE